MESSSREEARLEPLVYLLKFQIVIEKERSAFEKQNNTRTRGSSQDYISVYTYNNVTRMSTVAVGFIQRLDFFFILERIVPGVKENLDVFEVRYF